MALAWTIEAQAVDTTPSVLYDADDDLEHVIVQNEGPDDVRIGPEADIDASTGVLLAPGDSMPLERDHQSGPTFYAPLAVVAVASTATVQVLALRSS